jgi:hypothetical protein
MREAGKTVTKGADTCPKNEGSGKIENDSVLSSLKRAKNWSIIVL